MNTAVIIDYSRHSKKIEATYEGITIASGDTWIAAYEAKQSALIRLRAILVILLAFAVSPPAEPVPAAQAAPAVVTPPAAPTKAKKNKKTSQQCTCVACTKSTTANGVHFCAAGKEWAVFDNGHFVGYFPKKERRQAEDALNASRYERLRRAA